MLWFKYRIQFEIDENDKKIGNRDEQRYNIISLRNSMKQKQKVERWKWVRWTEWEKSRKVRKDSI